VGNAFIVERITNYRDAIQFLHDQCVRHVNKGCTRDELVEAVAERLPKHLREDPWLQPYYGTPEHNVREVYDGYFGWYQADPTELAAPGYRDRAGRYLEALGGREKVLADARSAIDLGEFGRAMDILTRAVRTDTTDVDARVLKAEAMRAWGYQQKNMYLRNLALGGALEPENKIDYSKLFSFAPPDLIKMFPAPKVIESFRVRLDPDKSAETHLALTFCFTDTSRTAGSRCAAAWPSTTTPLPRTPTPPSPQPARSSMTCSQEPRPRHRRSRTAKSPWMGSGRPSTRSLLASTRNQPNRSAWSPVRLNDPDAELDKADVSERASHSTNYAADPSFTTRTQDVGWLNGIALRGIRSV
jgi:hypothetical protein